MIKNDFHIAMVNIYKQAKKDIGYNATRLIQMLSEYGGVETAKKLIHSNDLSYGFEVLWEAGKLDLTVEALVIKEKYSSLFEQEEIKICEDKLKSLGYKIKKNELPIKENELIEKKSENSECTFLMTLKKLKESSKEAVEGIEAFSSFKDYMHVRRQVEVELVNKLKTLREENIHKQLVLVCGSVGDGKSHIMSQIKHNYENLLEDFIIYNDATESDDPRMSYKEKLDELFTPFSDEFIENEDSSKVIVAINLGTLSNFIEDEVYKNKYSILYEFVERNKIIEDEVVDDYCHSKIDYVNFSDYSLYELEDGKVHSEFMVSLIKQIVKSDEENVFYNSYKKCEACENSLFCPVKFNYELLTNEVISNSIVELVVETIIKYKKIVSVRSLLDFFFSIIVPVEFEKEIDNGHYGELRKYVYKENLYWKLLLPNLLFEFKEKSSLFSGMANLDPLNNRSEIVDQFIIDMNILSNKKELITERFCDENYKLINTLLNNLYLENLNSGTIPTILMTYLRFSRLSKDKIVDENKIYNAFVQNLYYSNTSNNKMMKDIYNILIKAIYLWNGKSMKDNWINLDNSFISKEYYISQELKLEPVFIKIESDIHSKRIFKFEKNIKLRLQSKNKNMEAVEISIDYDLFNLLIKINRGYRLNYFERENYISFIDNLNLLLDQGEKMESVRIVHKSAESMKDFELRKSVFGGYSFERIN